MSKGAEDPREAHIWYAFTEEVSEDHDASLLAILGASEIEQHRRFLRDSDRRDYLVAHALLRLSLSRFADVAPDAWVFAATAYGRPEIAAPRVEPVLRFNLSHTHGLVACAVTREMDIGVDVECSDRIEDVLDLATSVLSPAEMADLRQLPPSRQRGRFFDYWTLKEAYIKARGLGLSLPPESFTIVLSKDRISIDPLSDDPRDWSFRLEALPPRHHLAVAARTGGDLLRASIARLDHLHLDHLHRRPEGP